MTKLIFRHALIAPGPVSTILLGLVASGFLPVTVSANGLTEVTLNKPVSTTINTTEITHSIVKADKPKVKPSYASAPLLITVDLNQQNLTAYRGLKVAYRSRISSGKKGHATPMGIFSILEKRRHHNSNLYSNAPMPYMQRLTWSGIALHEGRVPPYPASHGCVRLPRNSAKRLFSSTRYGTHVIIASSPLQPSPARHENLFQPDAQSMVVASLRPVISDVIPQSDNTSKAKPTKAPLRIYATRTSRRERYKAAQEMLIDLGYLEGAADGVFGPDSTTAVKAFQRSEMLKVSGTLSKETTARLHELTRQPAPAIGRLYVRQEHKPVYMADIAVSDPERPLGTHLAIIAELDTDQALWTAVSVPTRLKTSVVSDNKMAKEWGKQRVNVTLNSALNRLKIPADARAYISKNLTPGSSFAISDNGLGTETGKGTDFIVQTY